MELIKQLSKLNAKLNELLEDLDMAMDYIDNEDLYGEIDTAIKTPLDNIVSAIDNTIDDINGGEYDNTPSDEEDLDWD